MRETIHLTRSSQQLNAVSHQTINNIMNTMAMNLLNTIILCLFLPLDIVSQVHDTDTLCYKNDTIYQELRITRVNEKRIYFVLSSTKEDGKLTDMHKGLSLIHI